MPASVSDKAPLKAMIQQLDDQAHKDQSVKSGDFDKVLAKIDELAKDQLISASDQINLKSHVNNMKSVTDGVFGQNTAESNKNWEDDVAAINALVDGQLTDPVLGGVTGGHGPGTTYKNMTLNDAKMAGLPDSVANLQATSAPGGAQQVNKITTKDNKNYYVASDNASPPNYSVYNDKGTNMGSMKAPAALGLNDADGNWLVASKDGLSSSWNTNDLKSLSGDTKLFDLNGATDKLLDGNR